ncbi:phage protein [Vibrio parahaemolyticus]|nr:phage protein [Vibrio parahaemolyticus]ELB2099978.1 phage protein [Vibrio parahaemolyticus]ELB2209879.1 phage protein [Vibrio parahaemolyticus]ELB2287441.1 phage protein [Vibrio parahaemolyticus]
MKYHEMTKNYVFRELNCGLTVEEVANLCFKSVRTIKEWDRGKEIPPECKRLMRMFKLRELGCSEDWERFRMHKNKLELPSGQLVTPQEILAGIALLEIGAEPDMKNVTKLLRYARAIAKMKK